MFYFPIIEMFNKLIDKFLDIVFPFRVFWPWGEKVRLWKAALVIGCYIMVWPIVGVVAYFLIPWLNDDASSLQQMLVFILGVICLVVGFLLFRDSDSKGTKEWLKK